MQKKIVVGMSGGVDSSVAAWLLREAGWEVHGVMLKLWAEDNGGVNPFSSAASLEQAQTTAEYIGVSFEAVDVRDLFYQRVVRNFMDEYLAGKTPNPCTHCNSAVRWPFLLRYAAEIGAEYIATGHYARLTLDENGSPHLCRATDNNKDQSYVLAQVPAEQLARTVFPLADLTKAEVRELAARNGLIAADRPDSQDICFISDGDYRRFLKANCGCSILPGNIVNTEGTVIGKHEGLPFYTIGQRRGLYIYAPEPSYVLEKDLKENRLVVGRKEEVGKNLVTIDNVNWIRTPKDLIFRAGVQLRYKSKCHPVTVEILAQGRARLCLETELHDIAAGQLAVIYQDGTEVLGSGKIIYAEKEL